MEFQSIEECPEPAMGREKNECKEAMRSGVELFFQRKYVEAEIQFYKILKTLDDPLEIGNWYVSASNFWLGRILFEQKRHYTAVLLLDKAADGFGVLPTNQIPLNAEVVSQYWLGRAALENQEYIQAQVAFNMAIDLLTKNIYDPVSNLHMLESIFWRGKACYRDGLKDDALRSFNHSVTELERLPSEQQTALFRDRCHLALALHKTGKHDKAKVVLKLVREGLEQIGEHEDEEMQAAARLCTEVTRQQHETPQILGTNPETNKANVPAFLLAAMFRSKAQEPHEPYTDSQIRKIASWVAHIKPKWGETPRLYVLLKTIGQLEIMDQLLNSGFSDYLFPLTKKSFPAYLDYKMRDPMLEWQHIVLTNSMNLEGGENGGHCYFREGEPFPFEELEELGSGSFGSVHTIRFHSSGRIYARKRVIRANAFRNLSNARAMQDFIKEIHIIKRLQHDHMTRFIGSYTDSKFIGLIMLPVAETDLAEYLRKVNDKPSPPRVHATMRKFFGCLASALEFLHSKNVRHKDIKPKNILVTSASNVLLTDFGLSFDFTDANGSTTTSMTGAGTPRYSAPEVIKSTKANRKSDIWSLGVVYLEMITVLKGKTSEYIDTYFAQHGSLQTHIHSNLESLPGFIDELTKIPTDLDNKALVWVDKMLRLDAPNRLTASLLVEAILDECLERGAKPFVCDLCWAEHESFCGENFD